MTMDSTVEGHQVDGAVALATRSAQPALMASVMLAVAACALSMPPPAPMDDQPPSGHNGVIADQPPTAVPVDDDKSTRDPGADQPAPVDHAVTTDEQPTAGAQSPPVDVDRSAPMDNEVNVDVPPRASDHPPPVDAAQSTQGPDADPSTSVDAHVDTASETGLTTLQKVHASMEAPRRSRTRSSKPADNEDG
jgi:hypothetical protein